MNIRNMHAVDQLGHIKAQIAELEEQEKKIKAELIASGQKEHEGELFRAVISTANRDGRDQIFKNKIEELVSEHLSAQFIRAHTTKTEVTSVRVSARKGIALKVLGD